MKLLYPIFFLLLQVTLTVAQEPSLSRAANTPPIAAKKDPAQKLDELIVQTDGSTSMSSLTAIWNRTCEFAKDLKLEKILSPSQQIYLLSAGRILNKEAYFQFVKNQPTVRSATWNALINFRDTNPNDELFQSQWNLERISAPKVWDVATGGTTTHGHEIVVAVLDKGFDIIHPDLINNLWINEAEIPNDGIDNDGNGYEDDYYGWNFRGNAPVFSVEKHGTSVAGLIGANGNNGFGTAGINWKVKMMYLAVEYSDEVVSAFNYVLDMRDRYNQSAGQDGAFVVVTNGSFGIDGVNCEEQPGWGAMYDPLGAVGVLSVAATANADWNVDEVGDIPTSCTSEFLIAVTNTGQDDNRAPGSAYGPTHIDLGAPGQGTPTTSTGGTYREDFSGTSAACPHVAGSIALLYSLPCTIIDSLAFANPSACSGLLRDAILKNTDPVPSLKNETVSGGRLNVYEAMKYLHAYCIAREPELKEGDFKELYVGQKNLIRVFPSPTSSELFIDYGNIDFNSVRIRVFNMLGQEMVFNQVAQPEPFAPQTVRIDVSDWSNGVYVVNMFDLSRKISVKFVKD